MPKRTVIHALFTYTDPTTKTRATAYRGDTINVSTKDAERGDRHGAFGTKADLAPKVDEDVVDLTPDAPSVNQGARVDALLRDRLDLPADATEADVIAAFDAAIKAKSEPSETAPAPVEPSPPPPAGPVIVNLPAVADENDGAEGSSDQGDSGAAEVEHEGQAVVTKQTPTVEPPPQSAVKARWEAHAVLMGMTEGEAKATSKPDLIAKYGGS